MNNLLEMVKNYGQCCYEELPESAARELAAIEVELTRMRSEATAPNDSFSSDTRELDWKAVVNDSIRFRWLLLHQEDARTEELRISIIDRIPAFTYGGTCVAIDDAMAGICRTCQSRGQVLAGRSGAAGNSKVGEFLLCRECGNELGR